MATIDVSKLISNPLFSNAFQIVRQTVVYVGPGRFNTLDSSPIDVVGVIQPSTPNDLERLPEGAKLHENITVYTKQPLSVEPQTGLEDGYTDIVLWDNKRWLVKYIIENFLNYGSGWNKVIATLEPSHV